MNEPINVISFGAGVQSSTLALMASRGLFQPLPVAAIFADTQAEPQSVYEWLKYIEPLLPFPLIKVTNGSLTERSLKMKVTKSGFKYSQTDIPFYTRNPNGSRGHIRQRGCTRDFKINPIIKKLRQLVGADTMLSWRRNHRAELKAIAAYRKAQIEFNRDHKLSPDPETGFILTAQRGNPTFPAQAWNECQNDPLAISWVGISADESSRMKMSRDAWIKVRWPLVEKNFRRDDCLSWMFDNGFPKPPRSACTYCPFHNDDEWRRLKSEEPGEFAKAVSFELALQRNKADNDKMRSIPFLHSSLTPLGEIDFDQKSDHGQDNLFENECEGMCGV